MRPSSGRRRRPTPPSRCSKWRSFCRGIFQFHLFDLIEFRALEKLWPTTVDRASLSSKRRCARHSGMPKKHFSGRFGVCFISAGLGKKNVAKISRARSAMIYFVRNLVRVEIFVGAVFHFRLSPAFGPLFLADVWHRCLRNALAVSICAADEQLRNSFSPPLCLPIFFLFGFSGKTHLTSDTLSRGSLHRRQRRTGRALNRCAINCCAAERYERGRAEGAAAQGAAASQRNEKWMRQATAVT